MTNQASTPAPSPQNPSRTNSAQHRTSPPRPRGRLATIIGAVTAALALAAASVAMTSPAVAADTDPLAGLSYVALGDSYSAGYGLSPLTGEPVPGCAQAEVDYPHRVAVALGLDLMDVTCSGATTPNIVDTPQVTPDGTAPVQSAALSADTDIVTVTIGGNDLGFADIVGSCVALSPQGPLAADQTKADCKSQFDLGGGVDVLDAQLAGVVTPGLAAAFATIKAAAPNAKIFVIGYPAIMPDPANAPATGCFSPAVDPTTGATFANAFPFTDVDVPYLHAVQTKLDALIQAEALAAGATFIPTLPGTMAHSACAADDEAYVNGITVTSFTPGNASTGTPPTFTTAPGALHPNEAGVAFLTDQFVAALEDVFPAAVTPTPTPTPTPTSTPTPTVTAPAVVVPAETPPTDRLSETGVNAVGFFSLASLLVLAGGALMIRRKVASS